MIDDARIPQSVLDHTLIYNNKHIEQDLFSVVSRRLIGTHIDIQCCAAAFNTLDLDHAAGCACRRGQQDHSLILECFFGDLLQTGGM